MKKLLALILADVYAIGAICHYIAFGCGFFCDFIRTDGDIFNCGHTVCGCYICRVTAVYLLNTEGCSTLNDFTCLLINLCNG